MNKQTDYKSQGKKNRAAGQRFERKVRLDLENKGWLVDRWTNNVSFDYEADKFYKVPRGTTGLLVPAKSRFNMRTTGFPDFVAFKFDSYDNLNLDENIYYIHGIECKSNGYLTKEEKEKCKWLLDNNVFSKILIAKKGKKRGEIIYNEFNQKS